VCLQGAGDRGTASFAKNVGIIGFLNKKTSDNLGEV